MASVFKRSFTFYRNEKAFAGVANADGRGGLWRVGIK
jgi:hypothetical protein